MDRSNGGGEWLKRLDAVLPVFGHRNWIVVADSAYPAYCSAGIETIVAPGDHLDVVRTVFERLDASGHLSAAVYTDMELAATPEEDAPGVAEYRQELNCLLAGRVRIAAAHDEIVTRLDDAARRFRALMIKTPMRIPYSSVFFELGCGYWTPEAELRLRARLNGSLAHARRG